MPVTSVNLHSLSFVNAKLFVMLFALLTSGAAYPESAASTAEPMPAQFRGCETAGWCRFLIESTDPLAQSLHRVYPDGIPRSFENLCTAVAIRDRLNALLASMVHQHKRIVLHDLRELDDGMFAATITVNEADLAFDSVLMKLQKSY